MAETKEERRARILGMKPTTPNTPPANTPPANTPPGQSRAEKLRAKLLSGSAVPSPRPTANVPSRAEDSKDVTDEDVEAYAETASKQVAQSPVSQGYSPDTEGSGGASTYGTLLETAYSTKRTPSGEVNYLADYLSTQTPTSVPSDVTARNADTVKPPDEQTWGGAFGMQSYRTPEDQQILNSLGPAEDSAKAQVMRVGEATLDQEQAHALSKLLDDPIFNGVQKWQPGAMRVLAETYIPGMTPDQASTVAISLDRLARVKAQRAQVEARTVYEGPTEYALRLLGSPGSLLPGAIEGAVTGQGAEAGAKKAVAAGESFMTQGARLGRSAGRAVGGAIADTIQPYVGETAADLERGLVSGSGTALGGMAGLGADVLLDPLSAVPMAYRGAKGGYEAAKGAMSTADMLRYTWSGVSPDDVVPALFTGVWTTKRADDAGRAAADAVRPKVYQDYAQKYEQWRKATEAVNNAADAEKSALSPAVEAAKQGMDLAKRNADDAVFSAYMEEVRKVDPDVGKRPAPRTGTRELPQTPEVTRVESPHVEARSASVAETFSNDVRGRVAAIPKVFARDVAAKYKALGGSVEAAEDAVVKSRLLDAPTASAKTTEAEVIADRLLDTIAPARSPHGGLLNPAGVTRLKTLVAEGVSKGLTVREALEDAFLREGLDIPEDTVHSLVMQAVHHSAAKQIIADGYTRIRALTDITTPGMMEAAAASGEARMGDVAVTRKGEFVRRKGKSVPGDTARNEFQRSVLRNMNKELKKGAFLDTYFKLIGGEAASGLADFQKAVRKDTSLYSNAVKVAERLDLAEKNIEKMDNLTDMEIARLALEGMRYFLGDEAILKQVDSAGQFTPLSVLAHEAYSGASAALGNTARLMKAGMLGGAWLPNIKYHMANFLTAPFIMYAQLGGARTLGGMSEAAQWAFARARGLPGDAPLFSGGGRIWTINEVDDLIVKNGISVSQSGMELGAGAVDSLKNAVLSTSWGGAIGAHILSLDYNFWAQIADATDTFWRAGVLIDSLKRGENSHVALQMARESLFDYSKTTKLEKEGLGKLVWFWAFRRSNYASLGKNLLSHPERVSTLARIGTGVSPEAFQTGYVENDKNAPLWGVVNSKESQERWALVGPEIPMVSAIEDIVDLITLVNAAARTRENVKGVYTDASGDVAGGDLLWQSALSNTQPMISGLAKSLGGVDPQSAFDPIKKRVDPRHAHILELMYPWAWGYMGIVEVGPDFEPIKRWDNVNQKIVTVPDYKPSGQFSTASQGGARIYQGVLLGAQIMGAERATREYPDQLAAAGGSDAASKIRTLLPEVSAADRMLITLGVIAPRRLREIDPEYLQKREIRDLQKVGE